MLLRELCTRVISVTARTWSICNDGIIIMMMYVDVRQGKGKADKGVIPACGDVIPAVGGVFPAGEGVIRACVDVIPAGEGAIPALADLVHSFLLQQRRFPSIHSNREWKQWRRSAHSHRTVAEISSHCSLVGQLDFLTAQCSWNARYLLKLRFNSHACHVSVF